MTKPIRTAVLISGRGSNMQALIEASASQDCPYQVALVCANNPDAEGLEIAAEAGIATWSLSHKGLTREAWDNEVHNQLVNHDIALIALAGFMRILSPDFIGRWPNRIINIHPSLLPRYKGLHTHQRALDAGDSHAGCSVHVVTVELDDGPVLAQATVPITSADTAESLAEKVLIEEHSLYPKALAAHAQTLLTL